MLISLIRILRLGPEVSLNGSPTVSPTTVALCTSLPLPPKLPSSTYFLLHCPRTTGIRHKDSNTNPLLSPPISKPNTPGTPKTSPVRMGAMIAINDGNHHFALRAFRGDGHTTFANQVRPLTCKDTLYFTETGGVLHPPYGQRATWRHSSSVRRTGKPSSNRGTYPKELWDSSTLHRSGA